MSKAKKPKGKKGSIATNPFKRGLAASLAGIRAGGALALDGARQKVLGDDAGSDFAHREAARFVRKLGSLKGSYVKIGQMFAMLGEHFLPPALTIALHELEDAAAPVDWSELEPSVKRALGERFSELDIDTQPLAAASLAQVHRAKILSTCEQIVLKVQYPNLNEVIDNDFDAVVRMLTAARWLKVGRELDTWLASMRAQLHEEIDYSREAFITQSFGEQLVESKSLNSASETVAAIQVPEIYSDYSAESVLALQYCEGYSIKHPVVQNLSLAQRNALAIAMLRLFFEEVFVLGNMQTDPNFGNYLVQISATGDVKLVLLDFGSVLELSDAQRVNIKRVIKAGLDRDQSAIEQGLKDLNWLSDDADPEAIDLFVRFCHYLLEPLRPESELPSAALGETGAYRWAESELIQRVGLRGAKNAGSAHFELPAKDFSLFARKLTGVFTFIAYLKAEFNAYDHVLDYLSDG